MPMMRSLLNRYILCKGRRLAAREEFEDFTRVYYGGFGSKDSGSGVGFLRSECGGPRAVRLKSPSPPTSF